MVGLDRIGERSKYPRFAVHYAPLPGSRWWQVGSAWIGRDAARDAILAQPRLESVNAKELAALTEAPRRRGWHASVLPAFLPAAAVRRDDVLAVTANLVRRFYPFVIPTLWPEKVGHHLALRPLDDDERLRGLMLETVGAFDELRADALAGLAASNVLSEAWLGALKSPRRCFQFPLTGEISVPTMHRILPEVSDYFFGADPGPIWIDALSVFEQRAAGSPFLMVARFGFDGVDETYEPSRAVGLAVDSQVLG